MKKENYSIRLFKGDISGGISTALLALPGSMAYGALIFAPLGAEYIDLGIIAGITTFIFLNIGSSLINGVSILNSGPFSLSSFMLLSVLSQIINTYNNRGDAPVNEILFYFFLVILMAALFQILFGFFKLGELVKYIPYPVLAGLFNGTAILIAYKQLPILLGYSQADSIEKIIQNITEVQPLTLFIGIGTAVMIGKGEKFLTIIPAPFKGILAGTAIFYLLALLGLGDHLGKTIGLIEFPLPKPVHITSAVTYISSTDYSTMAHEILPLIPLALGLGAIITLRTLLAAVSADSLTSERSDANRELIGQGIGNVISSLFGGILGAGSVSRTIGNYRYGGRTSWSRLISGLSALFLLLAGYSVLAYLPVVVLAGMLLYLAWSMFDRWSISLVRNIINETGKDRRESFLNGMIILVVMSIMIVSGIFTALLTGCVISVLLFLMKMRRNIIRKKMDATRVRSHIERPQHELDILESEGSKIHIFNLEGSFFFGTADMVSQDVYEAISEDCRYIILDFSKVSDIDSTAIHILKRMTAQCKKQRKELTIAAMKSELESVELNEISDIIFSTFDDALAHCEDSLLLSMNSLSQSSGNIPLKDIDILSHFTAKEIKILSVYMRYKEYKDREFVFMRGEPGDKLYLNVRGRAQVFLLRDKRQKRISTLSQGTIFGEMAFIDRRYRSASVQAEGTLACYILTYSKLTRLKKEYPEIAHKILTGIGNELAKRIRTANKIISELQV